MEILQNIFCVVYLYKNEKNDQIKKKKKEKSKSSAEIRTANLFITMQAP